MVMVMVVVVVVVMVIVMLKDALAQEQQVFALTL